MSEEEIVEPTYVEIVAEAKLNPTEKRETIENILQNILRGDSFIDDRFDGTYLVIRQSSLDELQTFGDWVREQRQLDTVRERLIRSITGNITAVYLNRQAAAMGRLALVDINDNPPLGPVTLQIVSDGLRYVIDQLTPKTWKGKELTEKERQRLIERKKALEEKKEKERLRKEKYKKKYTSQ